MESPATIAMRSKEKKGPVQYPADHKPGMRVPKGGSCCANCKFWDGEDCENDYYRKWNGSGQIATNDPTTFCSDWWEPKN